MFVSMVYFRWYVTMTGVYGFVSNEFGALSLEWKFLFVFYGVLIKLFDVCFTLMCATQLYQWLFTSKAMVRPTKITKASLKRPSTIPVAFMRMQSTPLM